MKTNLFKRLLTALLVCCVLSVLMVISLFLLRSGASFALYEGKRVERSAEKAGEIFSGFLREYELCAEEVAESSEIQNILKDGFPAKSTALYSMIADFRKQWEISPSIHIVSPDLAHAVSTGSGQLRYSYSNYSAIQYLMNDSSGILYHANRFINNDGELVVMTVAKTIYSPEGKLLGYIYFDMKESEIEGLFLNEPEVRVDEISSATSIMVISKFNYCLYDESSFTDVRQTLGSAFLKVSFAETVKNHTGPQLLTHADTDYVISSKITDDGSFYAVCVVPTSILMHSSTLFLMLSISMLLVIAAACVVIAFMLNRSIIGPLNGIVSTMTRYGAGDMDARCNVKAENEMLTVRDQLNTMIESINEGIRKNNEMQQKLLLSEDNFLKAQIKPHFLNNVLESIRWMIEMGDVKEAEDALSTLGKMMTERMNYFSSKQEKLSDCLEFTKRYISIQELCYHDKLMIEYDIDKDLLDVNVPTFLLQPLVENAIVHGIQPKIGRGLLRIRVYKDDFVCIAVSDDGVGMEREFAENLLSEGTVSHGIALYNIHRRIQLSYGDEYGLTIMSEPGNGTVITAKLPLEIAEHVNSSSNR